MKPDDHSPCIAVIKHGMDIEHIKKEITDLSTVIKELAMNSMSISKTYTDELKTISVSMASIDEILLTLKDSDKRIEAHIRNVDSSIDKHESCIRLIKTNTEITDEKVTALQNALIDLNVAISKINTSIESTSQWKNIFKGQLTVVDWVIRLTVALGLLFAKDVVKFVANHV